MTTRHTIPVADDESVVAVHHEADADDWLVFCHGFLSDKSGSYEERCERAVAEGYNAVRFDFRGCGESDGAFVDQNLSTRIADLRAVVDYFEVPSYTAFGSSFGGKTAFHAAVDDDRIEAIITRAPVTYNRAFAAAREAVESAGVFRYDEEYVIDDRFFEDFDTYAFADVAERLDVPVAIFHGREDATVPLSDSLDAVGALSTDTLLQAYREEGHRFSAATEDRLREQAFDWLASAR
ncbi:alpha/beta hydrolase family protein [Natronomonas amylolytica]|uniref:alpha/beta hydrolase family protein n=1 Tax=Natronomonas amylolytica TaxID=3108498 RepID=UPI0030097E69